MKVKLPYTYISTASLMFALSSVAHAQNADTTAEADEILITGMRQSLDKALEVKQDSDKVMEALSLDDINATPAVTIAEALVRLPGVTGVRDRGNESQAAIRGLGPRMVFSTLNGREIASSEPGRAVRYEQYPSELMSAVEVYKSQSADLVEGGIAGTINLKTVSPLSYTGPKAIVRAGLVQNEGGEDIPDYNTLGNRYSASVVQQFSDSFAWALGVSGQKQKNAYPALKGWGMNLGDLQTGLTANGGNLDGNGTYGFVPWGADVEVKALTTDRQGFLSAMEFKPSDDLKIKYDYLYTSVSLDEQSEGTWYQGIGNWDGSQNGKYSNIVLVGNQAVSATANGIGTIRHTISSYAQDSVSTTQGLNFDYTGVDGLEIVADLNYSSAKRNGFWNAIFFDQWGQTFTYDFRAGSPGITVPASSEALHPELPGASHFANYGQWGAANDNTGNWISDKMYGANVDFKKAIDAGDLIGIDFGLRTSQREKENKPTRFIMADPSEAEVNAKLPAGYFTSYSFNQFPATPILNAPSYWSLANIIYGKVDFSLKQLVATEYWDVEEQDNAAYVKANFEGQLNGLSYNANVGVRQVSISTDSYDKPDTATRKNSSNSYDYTLPSATINLHLDDENILRVSAARAISRPPLDELRAGSFIALNDSQTSGGAGNPLLKPYTSDQLDVSYEWYFAKESMLAASMFYKDIKNYIGYSTIGTFLTSGGDSTYTVTGPINGKGGYVRGLELTFQMPFDFLPVQGFGIYSNYAHAESNIMEFTPTKNPYPMAGLSKHSGTVDLWYSKNGWDARLGWKYSSAYTSGFTWDGSALNTLDPEKSLSFSISHDFTDHLSARFQVWNITNEPARLTRDNSDASLMRYDDYGRGYLLDFTWKL